MIAYIDAHRDRFGVEPICSVLQFAPSTYWSAKRRPPCARAIRDEQLCTEIARVHAENFGVYGADKVWAQLNREDIPRGALHRRAAHARPGPAGGGARQAVPHHDRRRRLRHGLGISSTGSSRAAAPNRLWVADLTYVRTWSGFVYVAFVTDVFSRMIVGWQASRSLRTDLALHALEQAIWTRRRAGADLDGLVHHSDRGVQYLAIRYTERLAANGVVNSRRLPRRLATTTRSPRASSGSTRPNSSATAAPGAASTTSNSPPSNGSTGSTTVASSKTTDASHPPSSKTASTVRSSQPTRPRLTPASLRETRGGSTRRTDGRGSISPAHRAGGYGNHPATTPNATGCGRCDSTHPALAKVQVTQRNTSAGADRRRGSPPWGTKGPGFKSRQPDSEHRRSEAHRPHVVLPVRLPPAAHRDLTLPFRPCPTEGSARCGGRRSDGPAPRSRRWRCPRGRARGRRGAGIGSPGHVLLLRPVRVRQRRDGAVEHLLHDDHRQRAHSGPGGEITTDDGAEDGGVGAAAVSTFSIAQGQIPLVVAGGGGGGGGGGGSAVDEGDGSGRGGAGGMLLVSGGDGGVGPTGGTAAPWRPG